MTSNNNSVIINKVPVAVDFSALDKAPEDKWKEALTGSVGNSIYLADLLGETDNGAGVGGLLDDPLTELPEEPIVGQKKEDSSVLDLVSSAINWSGLFAQEAPTEDDLKKKQPETVEVKKTVKLPPKKKPVAVKKTPIRRVSAAKKKLLPVSEEDKAREVLIRKYRSYASRFDLDQEAMTKTTKQLSKYTLDDLEREYQLLKSKSNEGEVEEIVYDMFEGALNIFAKIYSRRLKYSMLNTIYGQVDLVYIQEVLDEKLDSDTGDSNLKRALAEAAIELAEWLTAPWYTRLCYHAHKIIMQASDLETNRRIAVVSGVNVSEAGRRVLEKLNLQH